jgi:hypothetical protein
MSIKADFLNEALTIKRFGMGGLIKYLETNDFFEAPASSRYHGNHEGGLAAHSMYVHDVMRELLSILPIEGIDMESVHICGLFHDVCKVNYYVLDEEEATSAQMRKFQELSDVALPKGTKTKAHLIKVIDALLKKEPIPEFKPSYKIVDKLPMGHGEKSVYIIQKFMQLTEEEAIAIRWHLGGFDPAAYNSQMGNPSMQAFKEYKMLPP